uniref:Troponin T n=1 Tax=Syphacia muris TaxID=451379 RepID=A0A0N5B189_9BILA
MSLISHVNFTLKAAKRRHQEEEAAKLQSYEEQRRIEREKIAKELRELKEKQEFRRKHREEEEREFAERLRQEEQRRLKEEAERRAKHEAETRRRGEERRKRLERMGNVTALSGQNDGPNYIIPKSPGLKPPPLHPETKRKEANLQERAEAKQTFLNTIRNQKHDVSNATFVDLKQTILALHDQIVRSEAEKYDLEKRLEIHEYDLKELTERQKQVARHRALAQGLDPSEALNSKYPPKISVASKFDRQIDRRPFSEIRDIYENPAVARAPSLARGTARPPPEWGRKSNEELDMVRKNLEQPRYQEVVKIEDAKPPLTPIPLTLPAEWTNLTIQ